MAAGKLIGLDEAAALVPDGARLGIGGVLLRRKPIALLEALAAAGTHDLRIYSFLASLDVELLVRSGSVAEVHSGYVGFEQLGFAPAYSDAVSDGRVLAFEYSEFLFVAGLRASLAGLPFLPTRGARGSDLVAELGIAEVTCPYTGDVLLAAPALQVSPLMGSNVIIVVFAVVVIGGMGSILGAIVTGLGLGVVEGLSKVFYPEVSSTVVFIIMAIVLLFRPAGRFGKEK